MFFKNAIFDADGTLIDSLIFWDFLWESFGKKFLGREGFRPSDEIDKNVRTMPLKEAMYYVHEACEIGKNGEEVFQAADFALRDFYENVVEVKDGVIEFLERCLADGVKMCIASATDKDCLKVAMKRCKLEKYFTDILSCADIGKGKDSPDIYILACEKLGGSISDTCVFEDSYVALLTAKKLGMPTVGIYDKNNYGQDILKSEATYYIAENETLNKLLQTDK